jgi:hypothetical protein
LLCLTEIKLNYLKILIHNRMHSVKIKDFNIILSCMSGSSQWSLSFCFSSQHFVCTEIKWLYVINVTSCNGKYYTSRKGVLYTAHLALLQFTNQGYTDRICSLDWRSKKYTCHKEASWNTRREERITDMESREISLCEMDWTGSGLCQMLNKKTLKTG